MHVRIHLFAPGFFQLNTKCIGMILITSTHYIAIRIYISSFQQFLKKSIYVNSFIMGHGKRSLQDFYMCLHQNDSTTRILVSALFWLAEASIIFQNIEDELVYIYHVTFFCVLQIFHVFFVLEGSQSFGKIQLKPGNFIPF